MFALQAEAIDSATSFDDWLYTLSWIRQTMCGIAGFVDAGSSRNAESLTRLCETMCQSIRHRGPDDQGVWIDERAGIALGQRRLSIVDLSPAGHQPMISGNGRYVITYNGEIYNFQDLRLELEGRGVQFRGHSDTEVMLEAFAAFGVEPTVKRLIGMFAIALWDRRRTDINVDPRPPRDQAALLGQVRQSVPVRLGAQGAARLRRLDAAHRPRRRRRLHAAQLHPRAAHDLRRRQQARARLHR